MAVGTAIRTAAGGLFGWSGIQRVRTPLRGGILFAQPTGQRINVENFATNSLRRTNGGIGRS